MHRPSRRQYSYRPTQERNVTVWDGDAVTFIADNIAPNDAEKILVEDSLRRLGGQEQTHITLPNYRITYSRMYRDPETLEYMVRLRLLHEGDACWATISEHTVPYKFMQKLKSFCKAVCISMLAPIRFSDEELHDTVGKFDDEIVHLYVDR